MTMTLSSFLSLVIFLTGAVIFHTGRPPKPKSLPPAVKTALVTGCASGFGRSIVLKLASEGFNVALNDLERSVKELESLRNEILSKYPKIRTAIVTADVSVEKEVEAMVGRTVTELGTLDVMVANAGICGYAPIVDTTKEQMERIYSTNATGVFLCYKYAAKQMIKQGWGGKIIGAASLYGKQGQGYTSAYCASKFAVRGMTQSGAAEWGSYGITVNAYAPCVVDTNLVRSAASSEAMFNTFKAKEESLSASGRLGTVDDVVNVVSFLASKGSDYITGQSICIDGGRYFD